MKNKKFLIVFILILVIVAGLIGGFIYNKYFCFTEVTAVDNSFKLTIPNRVSYKIKDSNEEGYSLDFYSIKDEMFFYSTVIEKESEINLKDVVTKEKDSVSAALISSDQAEYRRD